MATAARLGYGTKLYRGDGGTPETFELIAEIKEIGDFGAERELVEATNHDSPDFFREYILGLKDGSEFTVTVNWNPGYDLHNPQTGLIGDFDAATPANFQLRFPTVPVVIAEFAALVRAWTINPPVDAILDLMLTFKVTGDITWDFPSS